MTFIKPVCACIFAGDSSVHDLGWKDIACPQDSIGRVQSDSFGHRYLDCGGVYGDSRSNGIVDGWPDRVQGYAW